MEEDEYRATYHEFNQHRCVFEKSILSRQSNCSSAHKFCLAEREGVACQDPDTQKLCEEFLGVARQKAAFTLKLTQITENLPHAKEIRIQLGVLNGLQELIDHSASNAIENIAGLLQQCRTKFPDLEQFPFDPLIRHISSIQGRKRRVKREKL